jgi:hypothetical protein
MSWQLAGTYFETCNCDTICPCTWSGLAQPATNDRCNVVLAFHVDSGEVDGVDVSGLSWALVADTPALMSEGNWRVGVYLDEKATPEQAERLGAVVSGQLGGPPALLSPLIGEMLGVESAPIEYIDEGRIHRVRIGNAVDVEVEDFIAGELSEPVQLTNVFHPANTTLTLAPAKRAKVDAFGISWGREGESGAAAPFSWAV